MQVLKEFYATGFGSFVITTAFGVIAAVIGFIASSVKEVFFDGRKRKAEAQYLAIRLVLLLDEFVGQCYNVAHDLPEIDLQTGDPTTRYETPSLEFPADADWRVLEPQMMYRILSLTSSIAVITRGIRMLGYQAGPPNFGDKYKYRCDEFAGLGLVTLKIIDDLCDRYRMPHPERSTMYVPQPVLEDIRSRNKKWREKREYEDEKVMQANYVEWNTIT
ncbi:hypothetical protein IFT59_07230 [Rhizobium sp. CFBP 8752]|uniref:hypothetical protein n=1 Tax=Rhizobium sp. CFBP 8752 TaxID=2775301 RepID=UPI0017844C52|nr:hypothetical protein [Rhizobium sp. CFBP 8752]MBD8663044.1 hypothetical protein [Rhizobium sp. CFBP 8752]